MHTFVAKGTAGEMTVEVVGRMRVALRIWLDVGANKGIAHMVRNVAPKKEMMCAEFPCGWERGGGGAVSEAEAHNNIEGTFTEVSKKGGHPCYLWPMTPQLHVRMVIALVVWSNILDREKETWDQFSSL